MLDLKRIENTIPCVCNTFSDPFYVRQDYLIMQHNNKTVSPINDE